MLKDSNNVPYQLNKKRKCFSNQKKYIIRFKAYCSCLDNLWGGGRNIAKREREGKRKVGKTNYVRLHTKFRAERFSSEIFDYPTQKKKFLKIAKWNLTTRETNKDNTP